MVILDVCSLSGRRRCCNMTLCQHPTCRRHTISSTFKTLVASRYKTLSSSSDVTRHARHHWHVVIPTWRHHARKFFACDVVISYVDGRPSATRRLHSCLCVRCRCKYLQFAAVLKILSFRLWRKHVACTASETDDLCPRNGLCSCYCYLSLLLLFVSCCRQRNTEWMRAFVLLIVAVVCRLRRSSARCYPPTNDSSSSSFYLLTVSADCSRLGVLCRTLTSW